MKYAGEGETTCTCWCEAGIVIIPVSDVGERTASCGRTDCVDPALVWHPPKSAHRCSECGRDCFYKDGSTTEQPRCDLHPRAVVTLRRRAAKPAPEAGYVPPPPPPPPFVQDGPHSRACGFRAHPHGSACHGNCPTCHGCEPV